ncbi:MAG TPA: class I SAM-dependent methyltransferase [Acidobacteriaceae bacterium]
MNALRRAIPVPLRRSLKQLYLRTLDVTDMPARRRQMIPPRTLYFVGDGDYRRVGLEFRGLFTQYGGLKPEDRVLDVGCGIGRMAVPLTDFLSGPGGYEGFDIVKKAVEWCQRSITPRFPNFHFRHSDVRNRFYNPHGLYEASAYRFPYEDGSFEFVFLTSVFTHMFPQDLENYAGEIARVMKPGGRCFVTLFLLNEESKALIAGGQSTQNFAFPLEGCVTADPTNPEGSLAFEESYMRELLAGLRLSVIEPIHYGSWCGRKDFLSYQDILVATKG